jgi:hypothetical protein
MARIEDGTLVQIPHGGEAPEDEDRIAEMLRFANGKPSGFCSSCGGAIYSEDELCEFNGMCFSCHLKAVEPEPDEPEDGECCVSCAKYEKCGSEPDDYCRYWEGKE